MITSEYVDCGVPEFVEDVRYNNIMNAQNVFDDHGIRIIITIYMHA